MPSCLALFLNKTRWIAVQITSIDLKISPIRFQGRFRSKVKIFFYGFTGPRLPYGINKAYSREERKKYMSGPVDNGPSTNYRVIYLTGTPKFFLVYDPM